MGDAPLGSTALFGAVDALIVMTSKDKYRTIATRQRYGTDLDEIILEYDAETRTLSAGTTRLEADKREVEKAITEFLKDQSKPARESSILKSVEGRRKSIVAALREAVTSGRIKRIGKGGKGDPYHYLIPDKANAQESCSLVPTYGREQEKHEPKNGLSPSIDKQDSCSRRVEDSSDAGTSTGTRKKTCSQDSGKPSATWEQASGPRLKVEEFEL